MRSRSEPTPTHSPASSAPGDAGRIAVLTAELADQIAAGEVVERPASVVKELVENAIDAGAKRIDVELHAGGLDRIVVVDDGGGIHPDDLELAITRHATSKVRRPSDLVDVHTLGFRGEALASVAAVADVTLESRTSDAGSGVRLRSRPGLPPERMPVGMPVGTRIVVARLFATVPARRKFLRSEATEIGHCTQTVLRIALVHPDVFVRLTHGSRELVNLPRADAAQRVTAVLQRRGRGPFSHVAGERAGIFVQAWLGSPQSSARSGQGLYLVVRRRVVRERSLARIVTAAYGSRLAAGQHPIACVIVEPPPGAVDVNVHPQKSEVRFRDPQDVYTVVRQILDQGMVQMDAPQPADDAAPEVSSDTTRFGAAAAVALQQWASSSDPAPVVASAASSSSAAGYALRTRAASEGYAKARDQMRKQAEDLRERWSETQGEAAVVARTEQAQHAVAAAEPPEPELLTCLPGPVAVMRDGDDLLVVDLPVLRSHLVYRRLVEDLGGGSPGAQGLLEPVVVRRSAADIEIVGNAKEDLEGLGLVVEAFGDDALLVRAVPAGLRGCIDQPDVTDLIERVVAWLRVRARPDAGADRNDALMAMAQTRGADPAPRLARRWLKELRLSGVELDEVPGIRRWSSSALTGSGAQGQGTS